MKNTELYKLIGSLTKNEKGYFKKFALKSNKKESKIILLFDDINKLILKQFDFANIDQKLKLKWKADFNIYKNYLLKILLNCMCEFSFKDNFQKKIHDNMNYAKYYEKKGFYNLSTKYFKKVLDLSTNLDRYEYQSIAYNCILANSINHLRALDPSNVKNYKRLLNDERKALEKFYQFKVLMHLFLELMLISFENGNNLSSEKKQDVERIMQHQVVKKLFAKKNIDYRLNDMFLRVLDRYYHLTRKRELHFNNKIKLAEALLRKEKTPSFKKFYTIYNDIILTALFFNKSKIFDTYIEKFKKLQTNNDSDKLKHDLILLIINLTKLHHNGNFKAASKLINENAHYHIHMKNKNLSELDLKLLTVIIRNNFKTKNYKQCINNINIFSFNSNPNATFGILGAFKLMEIIAHFELKNFDFLPYLIRNNYRFLLKRKQLNKLEKWFINLFRLRVKIVDKEDIILLYQKALNEYKNLKKKNETNLLFDLVDFENYLEEKIYPYKFIVKK